MSAQSASGNHFAEVNPGDPLYRDLQLRGYNRRFVGTPDRVFIVDHTEQVVKAVDAVVASGNKLAVRSGGHCTEGFVDDPAVECVIDLAQMDSVYYDRRRRAFAVQAGATLGRVYQALDMGWGVTLPGGIGTKVGMGGHVTGGGFGPLSRLYGQLSDHLYAVETVVVDDETLTTLVNNYLRWCERNSSPASPAASVFGALVLFRKEFGLVTLSGQVDPGQPHSREALDTYIAEVTANVPNGTKTTRDDAPWQYTTIHAQDVPDVLGIPASQLRSKTKGAFLRSALAGSQIKTIIERLTSDDYGWRGATTVFATWGGKINALRPHDTAVAERGSVALFSVAGFWDDPAEDEQHLAWTRTLYRDVFAATGGVPVPNDRTGGCYINWPDPDLLNEEWNQSGVPWSDLYYGGNYKRLQEAKSRWDPHQVFNHVLSVEPG